MDSRKKSILKAISWRVVGTADTFVISYFITKSAAIGAGIAATEVITKIVLFYLHERAWSKFK